MRRILAAALLAGMMVAGSGEVIADDVELARRLCDQALVHYQAGRFSESATTWEQSYAAAPNADVAYNLATAHLRAGNCEGARRGYARYLATAERARSLPGVADIARRLEGLSSPSLGELCVEVARLREAIVIAEQSETEEQAAQHDVTGFTRLGQQAHAAGEYAQAATMFEAAHAVRPDSAVIFDAAIAHHWAGQFTESLRAFQQYLVLQPRTRAHADVRDAEAAIDRDPYAREERLCALLSRLRRAITAAEGGADLVHQQQEASRFFALGTQRYQEQNYSNAALLWGCANEIQPNTDTRYNVARALWHIEDWQGCREAINAYLQFEEATAQDETVRAILARLDGLQHPTEGELRRTLDELFSAIDAVSSQGGRQ